MNSTLLKRGPAAGQNKTGPALSVVSLSFKYRQRPVLHDVTFSVNRGTVCGLLGPNASGKTTLLKCINGILTPHAGQLLVDGDKVNHLTRREIARLMAVVPQQTVVAFSFTTLQIVVMGRAARLGRFRLPSRADYGEAWKVLDELGIGHLAERLFNELSGGEKQLVLLARALFQDADILLLDEPTSHLDFKNQFMLMDTIRAITEEKHIATVISLHDPNLASRYCSHMVLLREGKIYLEGPKASVFEARALEAIYGMDVTVDTISTGASIVSPTPGKVGS